MRSFPDLSMEEVFEKVEKKPCGKLRYKNNVAYLENYATALEDMEGSTQPHSLWSKAFSTGG